MLEQTFITICNESYIASFLYQMVSSTNKANLQILCKIVSILHANSKSKVI